MNFGHRCHLAQNGGRTYTQIKKIVSHERGILWKDNTFLSILKHLSVTEDEFIP